MVASDKRCGGVSPTAAAGCCLTLPLARWQPWPELPQAAPGRPSVLSVSAVLAVPCTCATPLEHCAGRGRGKSTDDASAAASSDGSTGVRRQPAGNSCSAT
eukprot:364208-Chlamydomonas_euryale.AAC.34